MAEPEGRTFTTNDGCQIWYQDTDAINLQSLSPLILLHGYTGSSLYFQKNIPVLRKHYRVVAPDLRGHGRSQKTRHGYHVARLAADLHDLLSHLGLLPSGDASNYAAASNVAGASTVAPVRVLAGSLGCAILWSYLELYGPSPGLFSHIILIDQSPLQNLDPWTEWDVKRGASKGMNSPSTLTSLLSTLASTPIDAYKGTIASCLAYRSHPDPSLVSDPSLDRFSHGVGSREAGGIPSSAVADEAFFLGEAMKGEPEWQGKLMADHTALDWRDCIIANLGPGSGSRSRVLVVASRRSGCFEPCGPLWVRDAVNGDGEGGGGEQKGEGGDRRAEGVTVDWGGHWCFWEDPGKFNALALEFLGKPAWRPAGGG